MPRDCTDEPEKVVADEQSRRDRAVSHTTIMPKGKNAKAKKPGKSSKSRASAQSHAPARPAGGSRHNTESGLSHCSDDYAKSLMRPWGPEAPCLPSGFPLPSIKRKFFARGSFAQGTNNYGFVAANPLLCVVGGGTGVFFSTNAWTNSVITLEAGVTQVGSNSTFAAGQFNTPEGLSARVVSAGLRVRWTGTELNRGGRIVPIEHPTHGTLVGFNMSEILAMQGVQATRPTSDGAWVTALFSGPKTPQELQYNSNPAAATAAVLAIAIDGMTAASSALEWEFWANYELVGTTLSGQTISHHDPVGASLAANAVSTAQLAHPHSGTAGFGSTVMGLISKYGREAITDSSKFLWDNKSTILKGVGDVAALL